MNWDGWSLNRLLILFTCLAFFMLFVQVTLFHYRQNFRHWSMWIPVLATPAFAIVALFLTFYNVSWLRATYAVLLFVGVFAGMFGSYKHIVGVGQRVGGYEMRNILIGPPVALPGMITALSLLGLVAIYWG